MAPRNRSDIRGLLGPSTGFAAVGLSAFVMLASGPRLVGAHEYSLMAVAWSLQTIFGIGLAFPAEQTVTTTIASGGPALSSRSTLRTITILAAATAALPVAAALDVNPLMGDSVLWSATVTAGALAWAANVLPRGSLAGHGRFHAYGLCPTAEAAARILLCAAAWVLPQPGIWLALAMALPLLVSAAVGRHKDAGSPDGHGGALAASRPPASFGPIAIVSLAFVTILNSAPLAIQWRLPGDAAGQYVSAMTYMRIPMLLTGGFLTVVLSATAAAWAHGDRSELLRAMRVAVMGSVAALGLTVVVWAASGPALRLYYGAEVQQGSDVILLLGVTTTLSVSAYLLTQIGLGAQRHRQMAVIWASGAAATVLMLVLWGTSALSATVAVVAGLTLCLLPAAVVVNRLKDALGVGG